MCCQWVVSQIADFYRTLLAEYAARGEYPVNGQVEIRVTGPEDPSVCGVPGSLIRCAHRLPA
ncbi:Cholesterol oxidase substrate-binding domain-containing protein OS=Streptomyces fumanus OX=67302 GN=GCM10018772_01100 PE=4 SV=1 [Streptomyces fumanus]